MKKNYTKEVIDYLKKNYQFRRNLGNQRMEFRKHASKKNVFKNLNDSDFNSILVDVKLHDLSCSKESLKSIIFSDTWPSYDPYKLFLKKLPTWDGHDYIKDLAASVHTDDDKYFEWCLRKWIVASMATIANDDVVNHTALILCGKQGVGKTTWFQKITPKALRPYTSQGYLDPKDKETLIKLSELWLFNMDEVANLSPKNVEAIKQLITQEAIYLRRAYTTLSDKYERRCNFCGTANGVNILHDTTGNRRFLCHNVNDIDDISGFNLNQLYAQAYQLFRTKFQYWFDKQEQAKVEAHNEKFKCISVEEELILKYYSHAENGEEEAVRMQATEILNELQEKVNGRRLSPEKIGKVLSSKGFINVKSNGISKWIVKKNQVS